MRADFSEGSLIHRLVLNRGHRPLSFRQIVVFGQGLPPPEDIRPNTLSNEAGRMVHRRNSYSRPVIQSAFARVRFIRWYMC